MNHPKIAVPDYPINELLTMRWSPYVFSEKTVSQSDLLSLFEAARWAPSSYNEQPWCYIVGRKEEPDQFEKVLSCLVEQNREWAKAVPVLLLGCTRLNFSYNGKPNVSAVHDLGLASANLCVEATYRGLSVHQMSGILPEKAREVFGIPEGVQVATAIAIGYSADPKTLSEQMRGRDYVSRARKSVSEFVYCGEWGEAFSPANK